MHNHFCRDSNYEITSKHILQKYQVPIAFNRIHSTKKLQPSDKTDGILTYDQETRGASRKPWLPQPNICYTFSEDVDPLERINQGGSDMPDFRTPKEDFYSTDDAQIQYLKSPPVRFLIVGKPGLGETEVGKMLAEYWKCVYLDPETVLTDEVIARTRTGRFVEFNLRTGRAIGGEVILELMKRRVQSRSCKHRGFVITGVPIVPNGSFVSDEPLLAEAALVAADDTLNNVLSQAMSSVDGGVTIPEFGFEEEDPFSRESNLHFNSLTGLNEIESNLFGKSQLFELEDLSKQIEEVITLFGRPFVIIYLQCPKMEAIHKRNQMRVNIHNHSYVNFDLINPPKIRRPVTVKYQSKVICEENTKKIIIELNEPAGVSNINLFEFKHLVKEPRNNCDRTSFEIDQFGSYFRSIIDKLFLSHEQQNIIKIDARETPTKLFEIIQERLQQLPLQKPLIPKKFADLIGSEEAGEEVDFFEDNPPPEIFHELQFQKTVKHQYPWLLSHWGYKCPVALYEGRIVEGQSRLSVQFMNRVFFLSDELSLSNFCRNPRPYLLPPNPTPPMKIFIFGTKYCGDVDLARCLGYVFEAQVIDIDELQVKYEIDAIELQREELRKKITKKAIQLRSQMLNQKFNNEIQELEFKRSTWKSNIISKYKNFLFLVEHYEDPITSPELNIEDEDLSEELNEEIVDENAEEVNEEQIEEKESIESVSRRKELSMVIDGILRENVPIEPNFAGRAVENPDILDPYIPMLYRQPEEPDQIKDCDPWIIEYVETELAKVKIDVKLTDHGLISVIVQAIKDAEILKQSRFPKGVKVTGGWVVVNCRKGEMFKKICDAGFIPDEVFYLLDHDVGKKFMKEKYRTKKFHPYLFMKEFLELSGFKEAGQRCPVMERSREAIACMVKDFLEEILENDCFKYIGERELEEVDEESYSPIYHIEEEEEEGSYVNYVVEFEHDLGDFEHEFSLIESMIREKGIPIHEIQYARIFEIVMLESISTLLKRYRLEAKDYAEEPEEEEIPEEEEKSVSVDKYGDTLDYCPISLYQDGVLRKGKPEYHVQYDHKIYALANEGFHEEFLKNPRKYVPLKEPPKVFPPMRVCVTGPMGSGKTTIARELSRKYGLIYFNFIENVQKYCLPSMTSAGWKSADILKLDEEVTDSHALDDHAKKNLQAIKLYFEEGRGLPDYLLKRVLDSLWKIKPFCEVGFVVDGFPNCNADVEYMVEENLWPDMIVVMKIHGGIARERLFPSLFEKWEKAKEESERLKAEAEHDICLEWSKRRDSKLKKVYDEMVRQQAIQVLLSGEFPKRGETGSLTSIQSETKDFSPELIQQAKEYVMGEYGEENLVEAQRVVEEELPEPVFEDTSQSVEEAEEMINGFIDQNFTRERELIEEMLGLATDEKIPLMEINGQRALKWIFKELQMKLDVIYLRNESMFETVIQVTLDEAKNLIESGYYFLSKFGQTCPVQVCENKILIQIPGDIFPMLHRQYVYFIQGRKNVELFRNNVLKYTILQENETFPIIPLRVAIIGAPKCGKTTLSKRFRDYFGLKLISKGNAIRYILNELPYTHLGKEIDRALRTGKPLPIKLSTQAIEVFALQSNGIVYDGFPTSSEECRSLYQVGLSPQTIIHLEADQDYCLKCLSKENQSDIPRYSNAFVKHRYCSWFLQENDLIRWLTEQYENVQTIRGNSKWYDWNTSKKIVIKRYNPIVNYIKGVHKNTLQSFNVTPEEFQNRKSNQYLNYCPICLTSKKLSRGISRSNIVQYNEHFYYICNKHLQQFFENPYSILRAKINLPSFLPNEVNTIEGPVHENGFCIVCFWDSKEDHTLIRGSDQILVEYRQKNYKFDNEKCRTIFMEHPEEYAYRRIHFRQSKYNHFPTFDPKKLPTLGYLQQTQSKLLTQACTSVARARPKYPKLSPTISGVLQLGLYLKLHNPNLEANQLDYYEKYWAKFENKCHELKKWINVSKMILNPYLFRKPKPEQKLNTSEENSITEKIKEPSQLIEFSERGEYWGESQFPDFLGLSNEEFLKTDENLVEDIETELSGSSEILRQNSEMKRKGSTVSRKGSLNLQTKASTVSRKSSVKLPTEASTLSRKSSVKLPTEASTLSRKSSIKVPTEASTLSTKSSIKIENKTSASIGLQIDD